VRILGVDPGSSVTGFGIIEFDHGRLAVVAAGSFKLPRADALPARLRLACDGLRDVLRQHAPDEVCLENVFQHANVRSALVLAHVRGALMLELSRSGLPVHEYTALQVKKALVGNGHADKEQVRGMVLRLLRLASLPGPHDVSDALAVAICHAHSAQSLRRWGRQ
jgi:crossover junction endodeoxyribonuclease RuvC